MPSWSTKVGTCYYHRQCCRLLQHEANFYPWSAGSHMYYLCLPKLLQHPKWSAWQMYQCIKSIEPRFVIWMKFILFIITLFMISDMFFYCVMVLIWDIQGCRIQIETGDIGFDLWSSVFTLGRINYASYYIQFTVALYVYWFWDSSAGTGPKLRHQKFMSHRNKLFHSATNSQHFKIVVTFVKIVKQ